MGGIGKVVEHKHDCCISHVHLVSFHINGIVYFVLNLQDSCHTVTSVIQGQIRRFYSSAPSNTQAGEQFPESNESSLQLTFSPSDCKPLKLFSSL